MTRPMLLFVLLMASGSVLAQPYNHPESVAHDPVGQRYLVSNFGDGRIVQVAADGAVTDFDTSLPRIAGLLVHAGRLYAAANLEPHKGVAVWDLSTDERVEFVPIPESNLLNDLAVDDTGHLFVTDYWTTGLYRVDLATGLHELFAAAELNEPNGIVFDAANRRMLVTSHDPGYPLHAIDVDSGQVTVAAMTYLPSQDGLAYDAAGNLYISSWYTNGVHRFGPDLAYPGEQVTSGHQGPADISIDLVNHVLCVPNYLNHTVEFIPLQSTPAPIPEAAMFHGAAPSPFNATTRLRFSLAVAAAVRLEIYDARGRRVASLADDELAAGDHAVTWSPRDLASGIYLARLQTGGQAQTRRVVLVE